MDTAIIRKEFILEGLCCGNCAAKIEQEVGNLEGVSSATVDFVSKTFTMEIADGEKVNSLVAQADSIVKLHDPDIMMNEKETLQPGKKVIYLFGLCCADCAQKIEKQVNLIDGVKTAVLDFVSQKLTIEALNQKDLPGIIRQASQIALEIEPDIQISYTNKKMTRKHPASGRNGPTVLGWAPVRQSLPPVCCSISGRRQNSFYFFSVIS